MRLLIGVYLALRYRGDVIYGIRNGLAKAKWLRQDPRGVLMINNTFNGVRQRRPIVLPAVEWEVIDGGIQFIKPRDN